MEKFYFLVEKKPKQEEQVGDGDSDDMLDAGTSNHVPRRYRVHAGRGAEIFKTYKPRVKIFYSLQGTRHTM